MRTSRRIAATAAAFSLVAGVALPAVAGPGPVVIDAHDSFIPTAAYEISSSSGGTVYSADVGGFGHLYLAPAPMTVGSVTVDLGPRPYNAMGATISGTRVAFPYAPTFGGADYAAPVTQVRSCVVGTCPTLTAFTAPAGYDYIGNAGDVALVFDLATNTLATASWTGTLGTTYVMPSTHDELPTATGDATGIVVSGGGDVTYVNRSTLVVTDLGYGNDGAVLTPTYVLWYANGVGPDGGPYADKVYRVLRSSPSATPATLASLASGNGIDSVSGNDFGVAWTSPNADSLGTRSLWTMAYDAPAALYARPLESSGVSTFENTTQILVNDRRAGTPGFYKITPGAYSGSLTGILPVRPSITRSLAVSNGRAVYADDTTADFPAYIRDVTNGSPGPESSLTDSTNGSVGLSTVYTAFTRPGAAAGTTDVYYGRTDGAFSHRTFPEAEVGRVAVSGHRVLLTGGSRSRVVDAVTGAVTDLGHTFAAIFGEWVATISYDTALVQRRNLLTGSVQTVRAAAAGCTTFCVDDDGWELSMWGAEVVYAFGYGGSSPGYATGLFDGLTAATTALPMLLNGPDPDVWDLTYWDGLLLVSRSHDVSVHLYNLRSPGDQLVDSFAEAPFGLDGNVVVWRPDADLRAVVRDVRDFYPGYAAEPRVLGGAVPGGFGPGAPASLWKPSILVSQELTGTVDLHSGSPAGPVVRSLPVSTTDGELAPVWDGKDASSADVPQGTYYWTVTSVGAAPVAVKNAAGSGPASGTVYVSRAALGAPALTAPTLASDVSTTTGFPISWSLPGAPAGTTYRVTRSVNGGAATLLTTTGATALSVAGTAGSTYRFRVTAVDPSGRLGAASAEKTTVVPYNDFAAGTTVTGAWPSASSASLYGGQHHASSAAGATYSFHAVGTAIWLVGIKAASYGQFQVSIDGGAYSGLIDAYSASTRFRQVLYSRGSLANVNHTIKIRVYGTAGRPTVGIDAVGFRR
jgi:hypothetical protein